VEVGGHAVESRDHFDPPGLTRDGAAWRSRWLLASSTRARRYPTMGQNLIERWPRFQLRADSVSAKPDWEVRWGAVGAIAGVIAVILTVLLND
jgi:hypothetical protein